MNEPELTAACPSPEALLALVRREGPEAERLATLDHVMTCQECGRDFELLRAIEKAGRQIGARPHRSLRRWYVPLAVAASVVLAVVVGRQLTAPGAPDVARGAPDAVALLAPEASVAAGQPITFIWHRVPDAVSYQLEVLAPDGSLALSRTTTDTVATIEPGALAGGNYRWWVRGTLRGAESVQSSMRPLAVHAP